MHSVNIDSQVWNSEKDAAICNLHFATIMNIVLNPIRKIKNISLFNPKPGSGRVETTAPSAFRLFKITVLYIHFSLLYSKLILPTSDGTKPTFYS